MSLITKTKEYIADYKENTFIYDLAHFNRKRVEKKIEKYGNFNFQDDSGFTPLMAAVGRADDDIIKRIISGTTDFDITDNQGYNSLMYASIRLKSEKNKEIFEDILNNTTDLNNSSIEGSALEIALKYRNENAVNSILNKMDRFNESIGRAFIETIEKQNNLYVNQFLAKFDDSDLANKYLEKGLKVASKKRNFFGVKVDNSKLVNEIKVRLDDYDTILLNLVKQGDITSAKKMVLENKDIKKILNDAARKNDITSVEALLLILDSNFASGKSNNADNSNNKQIKPRINLPKSKY